MPSPRAARPLHRRLLTGARARLPRLGFTLPACIAILEAACGGSSATSSSPVPTPTPGPPSIVFILAADATWLKAAGYRTILIGKYVNGYPSGRRPTSLRAGTTGTVTSERATGTNRASCTTTTP